MRMASIFVYTCARRPSVYMSAFCHSPLGACSVLTLALVAGMAGLAAPHGIRITNSLVNKKKIPGRWQGFRPTSYVIPLHLVGEPRETETGEGAGL